MQAGRVSDTALVVAMIALVFGVGVVMFGATWFAGRTAPLPLENALEQQPAELVFAPDAFVTNTDAIEDGPVDCKSAPVSVLGVDVAAGSVRWRTTLPPVQSSHHSDLTLLADGSGGHVALTVDEFLGERPPSILAVDVTTGEPRWQRFIAADTIHPVLLGPDSIVLSSERSERIGNSNDEIETVVEFVAIDGNGQIFDHPTAPGDGGATVPEAPPEFTYLADRYSLSPLLQDWPGTTPTIRAVEREDFGARSLEARDPTSESAFFLNSLPFGGDFSQVGGSSSPGEPVQVGENLVMTVIGSPFGPNTRLGVFDRDGSPLWTLDHIRAAALAGDNIVYDKRNEEPADAESTRDIFLVDGRDPERELWSTALSVNSDGGNGFLGTVDDAAVFAVEVEDDELDFLVIEDGDDVPELIDAAEGYGSGPTGRHHIDRDIFAAATTTGVIVQPAREGKVLVETDEPPTQVTRIGDLLIVVSSHRNEFCG